MALTSTDPGSAAGASSRDGAPAVRLRPPVVDLSHAKVVSIYRLAPPPERAEVHWQAESRTGWRLQWLHVASPRLTTAFLIGDPGGGAVLIDTTETQITFHDVRTGERLISPALAHVVATSGQDPTPPGPLIPGEPTIAAERDIRALGWEHVQRLHEVTEALPAITADNQFVAAQALDYAQVRGEPAARWRAAGVSHAATAIALAAVGLSPETSAPFTSLRLGAEEVADLVAAGWTAQSARTLVWGGDLGPIHSEATVLARRAWVTSGLPAEAVLLAVRAGLTLPEYRRHRPDTQTLRTMAALGRRRQG